MSSGRKVNLASDDPGAYEAIRGLESDLSQLAQFERNTNMARHYLTVLDSSLDKTVNLVHQASELAVRASDATLDPGTRDAMAQQADELLKSLLAVANSSEGGRYNFAGLRVDEKPYVEQIDPVTGRITAVVYTGSEETRMIKIGPEQYAATNIAGSQPAGEGGIFQTATRDLFDSVIRLRDSLSAGVNGAETDTLERLNDDLDHVLSQVSLNGARHEQVNLNVSYLREMQLTHQQSLESLNGVDMAEASMRLAQSETAYQAALYGTSSLMQQVSLLNYM
jgi:flagellar hook-associated protein 3 FlgL